MYFKKIKEHKKQEKIKKDKEYVCNLSNYNLSPSEYSVLAKGLKFIPTPSDHIRDNASRGLEDLTNTIRRTYFFSKRPSFSTLQHPFRQKSSWQAPTAHTQLESFLTNLRDNVTEKLPNIRYTRNNLTPTERKALTELSKNKTLIIKNADKGSKIVIENTEDYIQTGIEHLENTSIYEKLVSDPTFQLSDDIQNFVDTLHQGGFIDEHTHSFLKVEEPRTQQMYFLKKLHKTPIAVRPIVSGVNGLTEKLSAFLDYHLQPVVTKTPSFLKNTKELLTLLDNLILPSDFIFCTVDVSSLYLSIPQEEGTEACLSQLMSENRMPLPQNILKQMFDYVLKYNVFRFYNNCYKQIRGTAMGTRMAPAYAGIFMSKLEEEFLSKQPLKPLLYKRYIDDVIILWTHGEKELNDFLQSLNQVHPTINFTWEKDHNKITYLDVDLEKVKLVDSFKIGYSTHFKKTNSFQYVHYTSFHPASTKKGIIKGELTRISRTTSDPTVTDSTLDFIVGKFKDRAYPASVLTQVRSELGLSRNKSSIPPPRFKIPYIVGSHYIKHLVRELWSKHITDGDLLNVFPNPPMVVFTKARSLSNYLVHTASPGSVHSGNTSSILPPPTLEPRVHSCGHPLCKCCQQIFDSHNIADTPLNQHLNCRSRNIVYLIKCRKHNKSIYIGQTTRQLNQRLANHRNTLSNPGHKKSWPLYRHFLNGNHTIEDLLITPPQSVRRSDLLQAESTWIRKLNSDRPPGLNSYLPAN